jgi:hypothetical protein
MTEQTVQQLLSHKATGLLKSNSTIADQKRKEKIMPFGVNLMRSQVLYQAAQVLTTEVTGLVHLLASRPNCS